MMTKVNSTNIFHTCSAKSTIINMLSKYTFHHFICHPRLQLGSTYIYHSNYWHIVK